MDSNTFNGTITNHVNKDIAYIHFTVKFYDRMGHPALCDIKDTSIQRLKATGPIKPQKPKTSYWNAIIYNSATAVIQPKKIEIQYVDGTTKIINCTGKYWHSNSYYGGKLHE